MQTSRRQFLSQSGVAAMAALASHRLAAQVIAGDDQVDTGEIAMIDCHQHLWDLTKFKLPWIKTGTLLGRSYVMDDYLKAIAGTGIERAIYMEVDVDPSQQQAEAEHLIEICKAGKSPTRAAVVSGRPADEKFGEYARQFKGSPFVKGIRQVLHGSSTPPGFCLREEFIRGMKTLGGLNLSFDLCLRPAELADGAKLARQCPETRFILDHCGNADPKAFFKPGDSRLVDAKPDHDADAWKRNIALLAAEPNILCKISGIIARAPKEWSADDLAPIVSHCLESFGPERVIFGSDWPVCLLGAPLHEWVAALKSIVASRPQAEQKALFSQNAIRFYGLPST